MELVDQYQQQDIFQVVQEDMEIYQEDQHQTVVVEVKEVLHLEEVQQLELQILVVEEEELNQNQLQKQVEVV